MCLHKQDQRVHLASLGMDATTRSEIELTKHVPIEYQNSRLEESSECQVFALFLMSTHSVVFWYKATQKHCNFQAETLQSDIGKPACTFPVTKFRSTSEEENENVLQQRLNLEGCNLSKIPDFRYLTGRPRLRDRVLVEICEGEPKNGEKAQKQDILEAAVRESVKVSRLKLKERFYSAINNTTETALLARLYAATTYFGGRFAELYPTQEDKNEKQTVDLVEIGLASLKYITLPTKAQLVVLNEPLSIEVAQEVLGNWDPLKNIREHIFHVVKRYNGKVGGESLAGCVLKSKTDRTPMSVADFAKNFGIKEEVLPPWTKEAKMCFPEVAKLHHMFQNEPAFLDAALDKIANNPSYCSPLVHGVSPFMRPDVFAICGINNNRFFSVLISSKLYGHVGFPSAEFLSDEYSTAWDRVYHKKPKIFGNSITTEINLQATRMRAMWDEVLVKHHILQHAGSLRLHLPLPHIQAKGASHQCRVEGNDVIIYIDKTNAHLFFDTATCEVLAELTGTDMETWLPTPILWENASASDKKKYEEQAKKDKERYNEEMKKFQVK